MTYYKDQQRFLSQREKIVMRLKEAGADGLTNRELNEICLRYGARLQELYKMGYIIEKESIKGGLYKYVLLKEPSTIEYHSNAADEIYYEIRQQFDDAISSGELKKILEHKFFYIIRKPNWYKMMQGR